MMLRLGTCLLGCLALSSTTPAPAAAAVPGRGALLAAGERSCAAPQRETVPGVEPILSTEMVLCATPDRARRRLRVTSTVTLRSAAAARPGTLTLLSVTVVVAPDVGTPFRRTCDLLPSVRDGGWRKRSATCTAAVTVSSGRFTPTASLQYRSADLAAAGNGSSKTPTPSQERTAAPTRSTATARSRPSAPQGSDGAASGSAAGADRSRPLRERLGGGWLLGALAAALVVAGLDRRRAARARAR